MDWFGGESLDDSIARLLLFWMAISLGIAYLSVQTNSPRLGILSRWLRWFLIGMGLAYLLRTFEISAQPYVVLVLIGMLSWFLLETIYNWVAISAMSRSGLPLFPPFAKNEDGDEWPAQKKLIEIREWIRREGFQKKVAAKARIDERVVLRTSVYQDEGNTIRLQVLFVPQRSGTFVPCYILSSETKDGHRLITDNVYLPFGGFYPDAWHLWRRPLVRSLAAMLKIHRKRLSSEAESLVPWVTEPLDDINDQQRTLEKTNMELGFLLPREQQEEEGRLTPAGRYRVWKELWSLNYLGMSRQY